MKKYIFSLSLFALSCSTEKQKISQTKNIIDAYTERFSVGEKVLAGCQLTQFGHSTIEVLNRATVLEDYNLRFHSSSCHGDNASIGGFGSFLRTVKTYQQLSQIELQFRPGSAPSIVRKNDCVVMNTDFGSYEGVVNDIAKSDNDSFYVSVDTRAFNSNGLGRKHYYATSYLSVSKISGFCIVEQ